MVLIVFELVKLETDTCAPEFKVIESVPDNTTDSAKVRVKFTFDPLPYSPFAVVEVTDKILGSVKSLTIKALLAADTLPAASSTYTLYSPSAVGTATVVVVPSVLRVDVAVAEKTAVPAGATQIRLVISPEETTVAETDPD